MLKLTRYIKKIWVRAIILCCAACTLFFLSFMPVAQELNIATVNASLIDLNTSELSAFSSNNSFSFSEFQELLKDYHQYPFLIDNVALWFFMSALLGCLSIFLAYSLFLYIRQSRERQQKLSYVSNHDPLTGLYNRSGLLKFLNMTSTFNRDLKFSSVCLDMVDFKYINYAYGEEYGDKLLKEVATELSDMFVGNNLIARVGINEFVVIDFSSQDILIREDTISQLQQRFESGFEVDDRIISVKLNIGVSLYPNDTMDPSLLLQYSHVAMLRAKESSTSDTEYYHADMAVSTYRRIQLLRRLETAFQQKGNLRLVYQPILKSQGNGPRAEALLRWEDEILGFVPPDEFISVAEETPIIKRLNHWVINSSINQMSIWKEQGVDATIAINISRFDLFYKEVLNDLHEAINKYSIKPENIIIEIRESTLFGNIENTALLTAIEELKSRGYLIAIDDFGTGFSNFSHLNSLPVDIVKIDKSLVQNISQDNKLYSICEAIFHLCDVMGKKCVVEGVEDLEQFELTRDMGIHYFQGYHISKPLPTEDLLEFWAGDWKNMIKIVPGLSQ